MTDARLPERYLNDRRVLRLSDGAFRAFVTATLWSVSNRTDGLIEQGDMAFIPHFVMGYEQELVLAGLWVIHEDGYLIEDFAITQTSSDELQVLENIRRADREKKRRQRQAKRDATPFDANPVTGEVPGDASPGTTQDRTGQARQGQARTGKASEANHLQSGVSPFGNEFNELQRDALASWAETSPGVFEEVGVDPRENEGTRNVADALEATLHE